MIIKSPPAYDISHWKAVPDFKAIYPKPLLMITKATEGINYIDPTFVRYMIGMKDAGYHRGCYHFHRKVYKGADQARHFISIVNGYIDANTILILDVEEGGENVSELWSWFETVRAKYPNNRLMIYSRKNILDSLTMTSAEADYFRRIPTWTAGYPTNPDEYNTVPPVYTPTPLRWGPVYLWQYTDHAAIDGISGDVDCNWISPNLQLFLGNPPVVTEPEEPPATGGGMYQGKTNTDAKIWNSIGGTQIGTVKAGETVTGSAPLQSGYVFLNTPVRGYTKTAWLTDYKELVIPPPAPPTVAKVPFDLNIVGFKPYHGELEKA